jgi:SAM-dependent methyltransferase
MALHPLAERFASVAGAYERGRPDYPPAVTDALTAELRLFPGAPVLDLGAGTGKLSRALLAGGFDLVAVEPQSALREVLSERVGAERVRGGLAEQIPLPDGSVDAVTVADAFHWFDHAPALAEIRRVLRPGGGLAVFNAIADWSGASWAREVGETIAALRPEHPGFDKPQWQDSVRAAADWSGPREIRVTVQRPASPQRLVDYIASISWMASLPDAERAATIARIDALVAAGETPAELPVHVTIGLAAPA